MFTSYKFKSQFEWPGYTRPDQTRPRQGPRLTWKKSGGGTKYLKSGILTLATFISAKMHFFDQSQAFLELPMHEFSESVEKRKKN